MAIKESAKQDIIRYLLDKIEDDEKSVSKQVAETFKINQNTVHKYITELIDNGTIRRVKRGKYELTETEKVYVFHRSDGELENETEIFKKSLWQHMDGLSQNTKEIWEYAFSEMVNNVIDHSEAEKLVVIIRENYLYKTVSIVDDGVGIFKKIKEYFSLPSAEDSICELFKGKLTTDAKNHSGEGIFFTSKIMDEFIISSDEKIFTVNRFDEEDAWNADIVDEGTTVCMTLSNFSQKYICEVFDLYADVDGGFTKTKIPVKNIFDTAPVSRSQARRVCANLEKFEEVILDFEGVEWMGQAFAHQIFSIYQKEHPEISLVSINMNNEVLKMLNHVTR